MITDSIISVQTPSLFCSRYQCPCRWPTSSSHCRQLQPSPVVRPNARLLSLSFFRPSLRPLLTSLLLLHRLIHRQQVLQQILYHLFLRVHLVSLNMISCSFYPQSVRGGPVTIHKRTAILSFRRAVLHPWVARSPGQVL